MFDTGIFEHENVITIGDNPLTINECIKISRHLHKVKLSEKAIERINVARMMIDQSVSDDDVVYGITTGFGELSNKCIPKDKRLELQYNLVRSHSVGLGNPIARELVRCMMLIRLICFCNGNSGVRLQIVETLIKALNQNFIPFIPEQGTVGASGDLAPLSHMCLGLMGEGKAYNFYTDKYEDAKGVLSRLGITPITLLEKDALAFINGTQFITSHAIFAVHDAMKLLDQSNMIASMTIEALHGTHKAFDPLIHNAKPHAGQLYVANAINSYILDNGIPSEINKTYASNIVQDAYDLRCIPQIHGAAYEALIFAQNIINIEMNSSNDNPLVFPDHNQILSGGNFHGMHIGMATDFIAYAMTLLCNISERRTNRLMNPALNKCLPSFLTEEPGLNSGFMLVQYASAGITAENRHLANPASIHNIPTCNDFESVVSMGGWSSRKAIQSVENTSRVLGLELLSACQSLDFTKEKTTQRLQNIHHIVRKTIPHLDHDVFMKPYIDEVIGMIKENRFIGQNI